MGNEKGDWVRLGGMNRRRRQFWRQRGYQMEKIVRETHRPGVYWTGKFGMRKKRVKKKLLEECVSFI